MINNSPDDYNILKKKYDKVVTWLASAIGGNVYLLDENGKWRFAHKDGTPY